MGSLVLLLLKSNMPSLCLQHPRLLEFVGLLRRRRVHSLREGGQGRLLSRRQSGRHLVYWRISIILLRRQLRYVLQRLETTTLRLRQLLQSRVLNGDLSRVSLLVDLLSLARLIFLLFLVFVSRLCKYLDLLGR